MKDELWSAFSRISAACCDTIFSSYSVDLKGMLSTSPRTGKNLAPWPLPPVQTNTEFSA
jgi:hypothetical protein